MNRSPTDVLRSLKRYCALALGEEWEVRLSREEGAFSRPFAKVATAGSTNLPHGSQFVAEATRPFAVYAYPQPGETTDESLLAAQGVEESFYQAFRVGVDEGAPFRVPIYDYDGVSVVDHTVARGRSDYARVLDLNIDSAHDPDDDLLYVVICQLRLSWRRTAAVVSTGRPVDGFIVGGGPGP